MATSDDKPEKPGKHQSPQEPPAPTAGTADATRHLAQPLPVIGPDSSEEDVEAKMAYDALQKKRKARSRKRVATIAVVAAVVVAAIAAWALSQQGGGGSDVPTTPVASAYRGNFTQSVQAQGSVQPVSSVVVTPEVDGIIESVNVAEGSYVNEGDVLMTIKNDDLDKAVREADVAVRTAKAQLQSAKSTYSAVAEAYQTYQADEGQLAEAKAGIDSAQLGLESAQSAYEEAVARAAKRTVTAPSAGTVVVMNAQVGAALGGAGGGMGTGASGTLMQIADLSQMTVTVQVNEVDISKVAVGQTARATFSALPDVTSEAQVTRIATMSSGEGGGDYGYSGSIVTYNVDLLIPAPDPQLKPGMTAMVEILMQDLPDVMMVPTSALMENGDGTATVYRATDEAMTEFEPVTVTILAQSTSEAAVDGDLADGDMVQLVNGWDSGGDGVAYPDDATSSSYATTEG